MGTHERDREIEWETEGRNKTELTRQIEREQSGRHLYRGSMSPGNSMQCVRTGATVEMHRTWGWQVMMSAAAAAASTAVAESQAVRAPCPQVLLEATR